MGGFGWANTFYRTCGKRWFDVTLALLGLVMAVPLGLVFGLLVRLTSKGPVFFLQERLGRNGQVFCMIKFRSMAEASQDVTRVGGWLRETAMDELPQLINILRGQMSFVGPRPLMVEEAKAILEQGKTQWRFQVAPGLAGLAQLWGGKHPSASRRLSLDRIYVERCSFRLDLWILYRSVWVTLRRRWEQDSP